MICIECNNEFTPIHNRGAEHKYCSNKCRNRAAVKRRELRLKSTFLSPLNNINNIENEKENLRTSESASKNFETNQSQGFQECSNGRYDILPERIYTGGNSFELLKELYEERNATFFHKLKCQQLENEIIELKSKNAKLESELDELDSEGEESPYSGMLGGVMEQFKTDPLNTINFATELINNFLKPKT